MRILVVEDNERVARFIKKGLSEQGHTVDHAESGRDGLFLAATGRYDAVILDRMLPGGIDGLGIVESLRRTEDRTPILILSALAEVDDRIHGLRAGGDDYLTKPFSFGELLARLEAPLSARRNSNCAHCRRSAHRPAFPQGGSRWQADPTATQRIQAPRIPDAPRGPRGNADHAARKRLGASFRPSDQCDRRAHQPAATEDRRRIRPAIAAHGARDRLPAGIG